MEQVLAMIFDGWTGLLRVVIVGVLAYAGLVFFLRFSGKRTLAKLNAFDLVVTVALGSTLSSIILSKSVALLEGLLAFLLLIALQFVITWLSVRSAGFKQLIKAEPTLLMAGGRFLDRAMLEQRMTRDDVLSAVRSQGIGDLSSLAAVILETDGSISVVREAPAENSALRNVERRYPGVSDERRTPRDAHSRENAAPATVGESEQDQGIT